MAGCHLVSPRSILGQGTPAGEFGVLVHTHDRSPREPRICESRGALKDSAALRGSDLSASGSGLDVDGQPLALDGAEVLLDDDADLALAGGVEHDVHAAVTVGRH